MVEDPRGAEIAAGSCRVCKARRVLGNLPTAVSAHAVVRLVKEELEEECKLSPELKVWEGLASETASHGSADEKVGTTEGGVGKLPRFPQETRSFLYEELFLKERFP